MQLIDRHHIWADIATSDRVKPSHRLSVSATKANLEQQMHGECSISFLVSSLLHDTVWSNFTSLLCQLTDSKHDNCQSCPAFPISTPTRPRFPGSTATSELPGWKLISTAFFNNLASRWSITWVKSSGTQTEVTKRSPQKFYASMNLWSLLNQNSRKHTTTNLFMSSRW